MARPSRYEPRTIDYLVDHPEGATAADIVKDIGCSVPQAYRTVKKLHDQGVVKVNGKTDTGAVVYSLSTIQKTSTVSKVLMNVRGDKKEYVITVRSEDPAIATKVQELLAS